MIRIPGKDFFVAIEWLKIPYNEDRNKRKVNGKIVEHITYRPDIGINNTSSADREVWGLNFNNTWFRMPNLKGISISATIKY
jgi:hypothetical protein